MLEHLRRLKSAPAFSGAYYLEEWSVLSKAGLSYYLRSHLECLLETLSSAEPHEEFVYFLIGQLYQVVYMHKGSSFSLAQKSLLQRIARFTVENAKDPKRFVYYSEGIEHQVATFMGELEKHVGH